MSVIVPTVTVTTPEEYKTSLERIHLFAQRIHIDLSDGSFAPVVLLGIEHIWWPQEWQTDIHVMSTHPSQYMQQLTALRPHLITLHAEAQEDILPLLQQIKQLGIKAGVAIMKQTVPSDVSRLIEAADHVMIFSGDLGKYGGTANLMQLEKIRLIKNINASAEIGWDGGISVENAFSMMQGGVEVFNVGGAIHKASDPQASYASLAQEIGRTGAV